MRDVSAPEKSQIGPPYPFAVLEAPYRIDSDMKLILGIGLLLAVAVLPACGGSSEDCHHTDWCACSGKECNQSCADGDGCRFFCSDTTKCTTACGKGCNIDCHQATDCATECGDSCNINCESDKTCAATCGANCNYSCVDTPQCNVHVGANSKVSCTGVGNCVVECRGPCRVDCSQDVDHCEITCPSGAAPSSCADGAQACGSC